MHRVFRNAISKYLETWDGRSEEQRNKESRSVASIMHAMRLVSVTRPPRVVTQEISISPILMSLASSVFTFLLSLRPLPEPLSPSSLIFTFSFLQPFFCRPLCRRRRRLQNHVYRVVVVQWTYAAFSVSKRYVKRLKVVKKIACEISQGEEALNIK